MRGIATASAAACLVGAAVAAAPAADAVTGTVIKVAITSHDMYVDGPTTFPAGRVKLVIDASGAERGIEVVRFAPGYTFHDLRADLKIAFPNLFAPNGDKKKGLKALNHAIHHTTLMGGLYAYPGQVRHGTVLLKDPGHYVLFDDASLPRHPVNLTVTSAVGPQTLPATQATVRALTTRRFAGDTVLPAHGDIKFVNKSTESPHFLVFQHVKEGTTRKQVIEGLQNGKFDFGLKGEQDVDTLSYNQRMTVHLHLPVGEYAIMCFFPDPKTGMPHAFMGMVRIVHLK